MIEHTDIAALTSKLVDEAMEAAADPRYVEAANMAAAQDWERLCPQDACWGIAANGVACPLSASQRCPRWQAAAAERLRNAMLNAGIGRRHITATWEFVPSDIRRPLQAYCENIQLRAEAGEGLIIHGSIGSGKTSCLALVCRAAITADVSVLYLSSATKIMDIAFRRNEERRDDAKLLSSIQLLLIDDLDRIFAVGKGWSIAQLDELINERYEQCLSTCVVTNLSLADLSGKWLKRSVDRLVETCEVLVTERRSQRQRPRN